MRTLLALVVALCGACSASADGPVGNDPDGSVVAPEGGADAPACPSLHVPTPRGCMPVLDGACGWSRRVCTRGERCAVDGVDDAGVPVATCGDL